MGASGWSAPFNSGPGNDYHFMQEQASAMPPGIMGPRHGLVFLTMNLMIILPAQFQQMTLTVELLGMTMEIPIGCVVATND